MSGLPSLNKIVKEAARNTEIEGTGKSMYDIFSPKYVLPVAGG